tara:strand:- start:353 stop:2299 length:1947 start_codon:yes stop_codon:yes gene_type:complete
MAYININTGAVANDGTGDTIRSAFGTVNDNFQTFNDALFAGTRQSIISAASVTGGYIVSNTYVLASSYVNADSIVGNTVTSYGNLFVSQDGATIVGNVSIIGNLNVTGAQTSSASQNTSAPILDLHFDGGGLSSDDGKDIGIAAQYYDVAEKTFFLGWQNTSESLVYLDETTVVSNVVTAGTPGNVQFGQLMLSNTTSTTSTTTGALIVSGGAGVAGNVHIAGNLVTANTGTVSTGNITVRGFHVGNMNFSGADTIYINGSPVQTAATAFNGGTVGLATIFASATNSTSKTTGAVTITGGLGVSGNTFVSDIHAVGNNAAFRGNLIGTLKTNAQPSVTSVGTLTSLITSGVFTSGGNVMPSVTNTHWLGDKNSSRWAQVHADTLDVTTVASTPQFSGVPNFTANVKFTATTASTNKTTGAIVVTGTGGVGVGGDVRSDKLYVDNGVFWSGNSAPFASVGGADTQVQFNDSGSLGGDADLTYNKTTNVLTTTGNVNANHLNATTTLQSNVVNAVTGTFSGNVSATYFTGTATEALYADLAENYTTDQIYAPGTVVVVGGTAEVTASSEGKRAIGVISTAPAFLMNKDADGQAVALKGRVPCRVVGAVAKGDELVSADNGCAKAGDGKVFGVALESSTDTVERVIEIVVL